MGGGAWGILCAHACLLKDTGPGYAVAIPPGDPRPLAQSVLPKGKAQTRTRGLGSPGYVPTAGINSKRNRALRGPAVSSIAVGIYRGSHRLLSFLGFFYCLFLISYSYSLLRGEGQQQKVSNGCRPFVVLLSFLLSPCNP